MTIWLNTLSNSLCDQTTFLVFCISPEFAQFVSNKVKKAILPLENIYVKVETVSSHYFTWINRLKLYEIVT